MVHTLLRSCLLLLVSCVLVACGSGESDSPNTPPGANAGPAQSVLAGSVVSLDAGASSDAEKDPLTYRWVLTSKPGASAATLAGGDTAHPTFSADMAGSYVLTLTVSDGKLASAPSTVTVTALPPEALTIQTDTPEPLSGAVRLSLSASTGDLPVAWYVDLNQVGIGASATWDTTTAVNAAHLLVASVQFFPGNVVEIRRTVSVSNPSVSVTANVWRSGGNILVDIRAASPYGVSGVAAAFDGTPLGTLNAPNACSMTCRSGNDVYRFTVDAAAAGSGNHTMLVTATDQAGSSRQLTVAVPVSNPPTLVLASPVDGAIVHGALDLSGSYATDKPGPVTVTAALGDVRILQTPLPAFGTRYDLAGVVAGTYALVVQATDSTNEVTTLQRTITVASSSARVLTPILSLGPNGRLLAAEADRLVYAAEDQSVRLHDTAAAAEVILQGGPSQSTEWVLSGGRAYVADYGNDCAANFSCVYEWKADGTRTNLTAGNPWAGTSYQQHPAAHDGFVLWCNDGGGNGGSYTLYNAATGAYTQVVAASGITHVGNWKFEFAVTGGVVTFFYWGQTGGAGASSAFDIYRWTSDSATSTRLSTPGLRSIYPQTDGVRAAWSEAPVSSFLDTATLMVQPAAAGTATPVSSTMRTFMLRDGVLAWVEATNSGRALKASAPAGANSTLSITGDSDLLGVGGGFVVYRQLGKTYRWSVADNQSTLLLDAVPRQTLLSGATMYFVMGSSQTLYRLRLE